MRIVTISRARKPVLMVTALALAFGAATVAQAQQGDGGRGPGGQGGPGGFGGGGRGGQRGGLGQRELTLLNVPLPVMTSALQLTEDQQTRIRTIQDAMAQKRQEMMGAFAGGGGPRGGGGLGGGGGFGGPPPGGGGGLDNPPPPQGEDGPTGGGLGGGGNPGDRQQRMQEMRTRMQQLQTEETRSAREIQQLLSEEQKTALAPAMREWNIVQQMGLPLEIAGQLKLTEEQKTILEKQFNTRNGRQGNRQNGAGATRE